MKIIVNLLLVSYAFAFERLSLKWLATENIGKDKRSSEG